MNSLSSAVTHKAISLNAHCLLDLDYLMLVTTCLRQKYCLEDLVIGWKERTLKWEPIIKQGGATQHIALAVMGNGRFID